MRLRCMCLVIHAPNDLRLDEQDAGEIGPGQVLVRVGFGGICGSDLHYFHQGGFGTVRIQQADGAGPRGRRHGGRGGRRRHDGEGRRPRRGQPSQPCGGCKFCLEGLPNHCLEMRFYGSAMRMRMCRARSATACCAARRNAT